MDNEKVTQGRPVLGLALAGGGFRASLFHVGVLRRLQELRALRYVEFLSTVSGGSILGALYILHLKNAIDEKGVLSDEDYKHVVDRVEQTLITGIQKNLRNRLFLNPFALVKLVLIGDTLSRRMAHLYERYLYADVVSEIHERSDRAALANGALSQARYRWRRFKRRWLCPGQLPLQALRYAPPQEDINKGYGKYVAGQLQQPETCTVPTQLTLNATSLNSGTPFWFSSIELGDPRLGFIRGVDIRTINDCRALLATCSEAQLRAMLDEPTFEHYEINRTRFHRRQIALTLWWLRRRADGGAAEVPEPWQGTFEAFEKTGFPEQLLKTSFGYMRRMKLAAWYVVKGYHYREPVTGGLSIEQHMTQFWTNLRQEHRDLATALRTISEDNVELRDALLEFVLWTYYLRSTEIISPNIERDWRRIRVGDAVGASGCFPPVFSPYEFLGIYDNAHVSRLSLSDGGVYDNVGIAALLDANCTHIIASDTGLALHIEQRAPKGRMGMMGRIAGVLMDDVGERQRRNLRERRVVTAGIEHASGDSDAFRNLKNDFDLRGLVYFRIDSPAIGHSDLKLMGDPRLLAELRTDVDGFGDVEANALINQGYDVTARYMRTFMGKDPEFEHLNWDAPTQVPRPLSGWSERDVNKVLEVGAARFFRALKLGIRVSWIATLVLAFLVIGSTWGIHTSVRGLVNSGLNLVMRWFETSMPFLGTSWTERALPLGLLLLIIALVVFAAIKLLPAFEAWLERTLPRGFRAYLEAAALARRARGNILWFAGYLPAVLALAAFVVFLISFVFYYLPFRLYTRVRS